MSKFNAALLMPLLVGAASGCSSPNEGQVGEAVLEVVAPPPPLATPGDRLPNPIIVRAVDEAGNPVPGLRLEWTGDGEITPSMTVTNDSGHAGVVWQLPRYSDDFYSFGPGPSGTYRLEVRHAASPALRMSTEARAFTADQVDAGPSGGCGIATGHAWCWGLDAESAVWPPPDRLSRSVPFEILPSSAVLQVALSQSSVCVRLPDGRVRCSTWWTGRVFTAIQDLPPLLDLSDGYGYFCGRAGDRTAWCWRVLGEVTLKATQISSSIRFASVEAGTPPGDTLGFGCGLDDDGVAGCWGAGGKGQLGNGTRDTTMTPVQVASVNRWNSLDVGHDSACATDELGGLWCWGGIFSSAVPTQINDLAMTSPRVSTAGFVALAWNGLSTIAFNGNARFPMRGILSGVPLKQVSADGQVACARTWDDQVYCSWTSVYGGSDSSLNPSDLVAVPPIALPSP